MLLIKEDNKLYKIPYLEEISKQSQKAFLEGHAFGTDGYLVCSVWNVSEEILRKYIENQG